ncbi:MAG: PP2C family serine/threonine-protein phosphatase [Thermoflexibacter sp.]
MSEEIDWIVVWASAIGGLHAKENLPCQDACLVKNLGKGWGIATLADGAGSCENSHKGAEQCVQLAIQHFANLIHQKQWIEKNFLPYETEWKKLASEHLLLVKQDLQIFAQQNAITLDSLSCTLIVLVYSPSGLLLTHIGDGRAGYLNGKTEWHSLMTPFKGEEANQTIFITSEFAENIGVKLIKEEIQAFCLLSDGCEKAAFECNLFDKEKNIYYDPNRPFPKFFNPNILALKELEKQQKNQDEMNQLWQYFLMNGNAQLRHEPDDKTLILGVRK